MNKNDITDEMLVALADDELPETEAAEVHSIVMEHDDLMRRYSSFVETRFLLQEDAKKKIELSVETERFIDEQLGLASEDNVVPLASRKKLQPITRARQFMQMAAALAVGVMVGPLAMMTGVFVTPVAVTQLADNGEGLRPIVRNGLNSSIDLVITPANGGTVESGSNFDFKEPFKVKVQPSIDGHLSIFQLESNGNFEPWPDQNIFLKKAEIYETISYKLDAQFTPLTLKVILEAESGSIIERLFIFDNSNGGFDEKK